MFNHCPRSHLSSQSEKEASGGKHLQLKRRDREVIKKDSGIESKSPLFRVDLCRHTPSGHLYAIKTISLATESAVKVNRSHA